MIKCIEYTPSIQDKLDTFFFKVFESCGFMYEPKSKHIDLKNINKVFCNHEGSFWLLIEDNKVVGTAGLKVIDSINKIGELKCMYLLPEMQGKGLGQLLMDKILSESKRIHLQYIRLDVKTNADKAIKLYRKNGFYSIPRYNDNKNDVAFMEFKI